MPFRIYIVPVVGTGAHSDPRRPKYFTDGTIAAATYGTLTYGTEPRMIVGADLPSADDVIIVGKPDSLALPFDLSPNLTGGQVTAVRAALESSNIPAGWVTTADTWVSVFRGVAGMCSFLSRYDVIYATANGVSAPSLFVGGVTLASAFSSLPAAVQAALIATAQDQGISTAGLSGATTLRTILRSMADHYSQMAYDFNGVTI